MESAKEVATGWVKLGGITYVTHAWRHQNQLFFCPQCGKDWARAYCGYLGEPWVARGAPCPSCSPTLASPPGSLWVAWDAEYKFSLPRELLERELTLHMAQDSYFTYTGAQS